MISHHLRRAAANNLKPAPIYGTGYNAVKAISEGVSYPNSVGLVSGAVEGDLLILFLLTHGGVGFVPTDAGWTSVGFGIYYKYAGASESALYNFESPSTGGSATGGVRISMMRIRGGTFSGATSRTTNSGVGSSVTTASKTLSTPNSLVICYFTDADIGIADTYTLPGGYTKRMSGGTTDYRSFILGTKTFAATGATGTVTATFDAPNTLHYGMLLEITPT